MTVSPRRAVRPEIQSLRAIAVAGVVVFHVWPDVLPGGYVGVDVFFVVSGYLITGHLVAEWHRHGRIRLARFWGRRIRRLLPAALLVLTFCAAAAAWWLPPALRRQNFAEIIASATYGENWRLAADAVDYLGAENSPSLVQHYWSLSVEEQFYLLWPLVIVGAIVLARRSPATDPVRLVMLCLGGVVAVSLVWSVTLTASNPAAAFFVTPTRMWEFAAGGLLAVALPVGLRRFRAGTAWLGWVTVVGSLVLFTEAVAFPGIAATVPVLGATAVIAAGPDTGARVVDSAVRWRPLRVLGDVSYSLYLWHWPLVVLAGLALDRGLGWGTGVALIGACVGLAALTKRWVEDPIRFSTRPSAHAAAPFIAAAAAMALVCAGPWAGMRHADAELARAEALTAELTTAGAPCFGADAALGGSVPCHNAALEDVLLPAPAARMNDVGDAYACYDAAPEDGAGLSTCTVGSTAPDATRIALVGDSHAASLLPGLEAAAVDERWSVDVFVARGCEWMEPAAADPGCATHQRAVGDAVSSGGYDAVLVTMKRTADGEETTAQAVSRRLAAAWAPVVAAGTPVIALADNPLLPATTVECVTASRNLDAMQGCTASHARAFENPDPLIEAVNATGRGAHLVDLTDAYCSGGTCPAVVGNVIVYRDAHHITATFSRTLAPFLIDRVESILESRRSP